MAEQQAEQAETTEGAATDGTEPQGAGTDWVSESYIIDIIRHDVRRSPANYVRRLSQKQAQTLLTQQGFIPMWDTDAAAMALFNVRRLAKSVPVLRVFCGMRAEDAQVIYDVLINHPELSLRVLHN